jgi:hypothetical protein
MAMKPASKTAGGTEAAAAANAKQRRIPGNLPYLGASGTLKKALDGIQEASRPDKFNADFLENVLKLKGGSARATIPILKKMGFLTSDGTPTDLYAKFRTEGGRGQAALQGLRAAFPEIFKKSEYAHAVDGTKLKDIIVEITGLKASDQVAALIRATFNVVKSYIPANLDISSPPEEISTSDDGAQETSESKGVAGGSIRLAYNINIVLPDGISPIAAQSSPTIFRARETSLPCSIWSTSSS